MNGRTAFMLIGLLGSVTALPQTVFAQSNPYVGTWQLNLAKTKYSPGPPPKTLTLNLQAEGQGQRATFNGENAGGEPDQRHVHSRF